MGHRPALWLLLLPLLLAACALQPPVPPRPARAAIDSFSLEGRLALRQGERPYHAGISWRHDIQRDEILLTGPLGQGIAELDRDPRGARLTTSEGKVHQAPDWAALAEEVLGLTLPLNELPRWLAARVEARSRDEQGRPRRAWVDGWQIDYLDYESDSEDALPTLLEMRRDDIDLRLKIDQWQLP
ncbi:lipoprotein insertase outer membrane protein LolB [Denitratisoma sp. DHT3]|uniref:lipoprotein insertase outer membrane protein LolB n=1 Tax=Denitratisoma sp. DHT3 TaxID=1981880 RepID=UPI001648B7B6|nr:lipoprotein insertase outer membrane protein LolB [Denitratisoma sp. DHT3]